MRKISILGLAALGAITIATYADVIPTLSSITQNGNDFTWNYSANVLVDQRVETGDFFTIYDFGSFAPGSNMQPAGWEFSSSLLGRTPAFLTARDFARIHDDSSILNLTWTYIGQNPIIGPDFLGTFSVTNNTNEITTGQFAAQATHNGGLYNGGKTANIGDVSVPVPEMSALLPILSVCTASLLALAPSFLRRRRIA